MRRGHDAIDELTELAVYYESDSFGLTSSHNVSRHFSPELGLGEHYCAYRSLQQPFCSSDTLLRERLTFGKARCENPS